MNTFFPIATVALLVFANLIFSVGCSTSVPTVQWIEFESHALAGSIDTNGKVEVEQVFEIRSRNSGTCQRIRVREGDLVAKGDPLLRIEDRVLQSELAAARAEFVSAEVDLRNVSRSAPPEELNQAESEVARYRLEVGQATKILETNQWLLERDAISRHEVERSQSSLARLKQSLDAAVSRSSDLRRRFEPIDQDRASLRVQAAKARIEYLERRVRDSVVRAPADGIVYEFDLKDGTYLQKGDLIARVGDVARLQVRAYVDEPDLGRVKQGSAIRVQWDAYPDDDWKGRVEKIPARVVALGTRSVGELICSIESPKQKLIPNINVDVAILPESEDTVASLPREVVFLDGDTPFVWLLNDGRAKKRPVTTGRSTADRIEVTGGITLGDRVIVPGGVVIADDMPVQILKD